MVQGLPHLDITYCKHGFPYRKCTRIWTNLHWHRLWTPPNSCSRSDPCPLYNGRHPATAQRGPRLIAGKRVEGDRFSLNQLYSMPPLFCEELVAAVVQGLGRVTTDAVDEALDSPGGLNGRESNGLAARNSQLEAPSVDLSTSAVEQQRIVPMEL